MKSEKIYREAIERKDFKKFIDELYCSKKTFRVPWIHGSITVKVIEYHASNTLNFYYAVRKGSEVIESNQSQNPDLIIERLEYYTSLGREVCGRCGSENIYSYKDFMGINYHGCKDCEGRRISVKYEV